MAHCALLPGRSWAAVITLARTASRPRGSPITHGQKAVRAQSVIVDENIPKGFCFYPKPCFWYGWAFHPYQKQGWRAERAMIVHGKCWNLRHRNQIGLT